ncbi:hypothetical protein RHMOL_Rhmol06G0003700 [Rhododendron molle]|uniref:Uncharacterized protein n=1 Tax=Rhododendron molle TaxID=49168 RepID=A0ACC0N739_RHOML|nr:hypothetical protein RHMOL_Rhmol06G0003700 [Rhododendron molle]
MFGPGESVDTATTVQFEPGAPAEGVIHGLQEKSSRARVAAAPHHQSGPPEKRARHKEGGSNRRKEKEPIIIEEEQEGGGVERPTDGEDGSWFHPRELPRALEFGHYASRVISHADSIKNLSVAYDFHTCKNSFSSILCWQVGTRALAVNRRCKVGEQEIEELKKDLTQREDDLRMARETCDLYLVDFQKCNRDRELAEGRATKAEQDATTLRATRATEVDFARNRGYDEGWDTAGVDKISLLEDSKLRALPEAPPEELVLPGEEDEEMQNAEVDPIAPVLGHNTEATVAAFEGHADPNAPAPN